MDEIVDELAKDERVKVAYDLWYEMREEVLRSYGDHLPERLPLSQQKELKRIKNMVIEEAVRLGAQEPGVTQENAPSKDPPPEPDTEKPSLKARSVPVEVRHRGKKCIPQRPQERSMGAPLGAVRDKTAPTHGQDLRGESAAQTPTHSIHRQ